MSRNGTLALLFGLLAGLAACGERNSDPAGPELAPAAADAEPRAAAPRWATTRLSIRSGLATDVNNQGQVVGYHHTTQGTRAFLWSNGTLRNLGTLGGGGSWALAINEAGAVVGRSTTASGATRAFLWQDGVMRDLGALGADYSVATGLDAAGRVVGYTDRFDGSETLAFLWENGQMRRLPGLDRGHSTATAIDNQGRIVGWYGDPVSPRAFLWSAGRVTDLGTLGGQTAIAGALAGGRIVGWSIAGSGAQRAFLWQNGSMAGLGTLAGGGSSANGINALGHVVGWSQQPDSQARAFLWKEGVMSTIATGQAEDINKAGWVVGSGSVPFPVLWRLTTDPPPPPSVTVGTSYFLSDRNWSTDAAVDTVAVGTRLTWTWVTGPAVSHSVQSVGTPSFPSSPLMGGVGVTYSIRFDRAGTYRYNCVAHPGNMFGRVVVK